MKNNPTLTISVDHSQNKEKTSYELVYYYSLDGEYYGSKKVDGSTKQELIKKVFDISNLVVLNQSKEIIQGKIISLGKSVYQLILSEKVQNYLSNPNNTSLMIDTIDHDIPWEVTHDNDNFICCKMALGRRVPKKKMVLPSTDKGINICLIGDPNENLEGAQIEIEFLYEKLSKVLRKLESNYDINTELKVLLGENATKNNVLLETLISLDKHWDIIHYAGHANFVVSNPESSSLLLADSELKAFEVEDLNSGALVFINACNSALTSKEQSALSYGLLKGISLSFVKGGALGCIGSLWPIDDFTAQLICKSFYQQILEGAGIGEAMLEAKKEAIFQNRDPVAVGYVLYGDPLSKLSVYEPTLTFGPYINEEGFKHIIKLEREYPSLEILLVNDLPWILWRTEDFATWISRFPGTENQKMRMNNMLCEYHECFRDIVIKGEKKFTGITNLKTLRKYLSEKDNAVRIELLNDLEIFAKLPNFTLLFYDGDEEEIEEIEIVSKNTNIYQSLSQSVYVFNKQVRFEKRPPTYSLHLNYNSSLIKEYVDRFFKYYNNAIKQYSSRLNTIPKISDVEISNVELNSISIQILKEEINKI